MSTVRGQFCLACGWTKVHWHVSGDVGRWWIFESLKTAEAFLKKCKKTIRDSGATTASLKIVKFVPEFGTTPALPTADVFTLR